MIYLFVGLGAPGLLVIVPSLYDEPNAGLDPRIVASIDPLQVLSPHTIPLVLLVGEAALQLLRDPGPDLPLRWHLRGSEWHQNVWF